MIVGSEVKMSSQDNNNVIYTKEPDSVKILINNPF